MTERYSYQGRDTDHEERELWSTTGAFRANEQSVDLFIQTTHPSFLYETRCFKRICDKLEPEQFAIGPHLVDYLLQDDDWNTRIRPDGLIFTHGHDHWTLSTIIEIRSGKLGAHRKLRGFSELLQAFRTTPRFLPSLLQDTIGDMYQIPKNIYIPEDRDLHVIFAGPTDTQLPSSGYGQMFTLSTMKIPMKHS